MFFGLTFVFSVRAIGITILVILGLWFSDDGSLSKLPTVKAPIPNVKFDNFEPKPEIINPKCGTFPRGNCDPKHHEFKEQYKIGVKKDCSGDECFFELKGKYPKNMKLYAVDDYSRNHCSFVDKEFLSGLGDKNTDAEYIYLNQEDGKFEAKIKLERGVYTSNYNSKGVCFVARPQNPNEEIVKGVLVEVSSDFEVDK